MDWDDYRDARMISEPLRLFDLCLENDGACAFVVTSADRARALRDDPVYVLSATQTLSPYREPMGIYVGGELLELFPPAAADRLFAEAGRAPGRTSTSPSSTTRPPTCRCAPWSPTGSCPTAQAWRYVTEHGHRAGQPAAGQHARRAPVRGVPARHERHARGGPPAARHRVQPGARRGGRPGRRPGRQRHDPGEVNTVDGGCSRDDRADRARTGRRPARGASSSRSASPAASCGTRRCRAARTATRRTSAGVRCPATARSTPTRSSATPRTSRSRTQIPYVLAIVELAEGPRLVTAPHRRRPGRGTRGPCRSAWSSVRSPTAVTLPYFEPVLKRDNSNKLTQASRAAG